MTPAKAWIPVVSYTLIAPLDYEYIDIKTKHRRDYAAMFFVVPAHNEQ